MVRCLLFTKTRWSETPRLRHQVARLLAAAGHAVVFFERPSLPWQAVPAPARPEPGISVMGHREALHHKLRLLPTLARVNAVVVLRSIDAALRALGPSDGHDVIINFNYDYAFLRRRFPASRLITIINDDFWSSAMGGYVRPLTRALAETCAASDHVLTVSEPLADQLRAYCAPVLFQPWADVPYRTPASAGLRSTLLFWGHINRRVDFPLVHTLAATLAVERPDVRVLLVGPVEDEARRDLDALGARPNVEVRPATALDALPLDRVLAGLIPIRPGIAEFDVITLPNKALQLLSRGLPLLISGMPHFLRAPFVDRVEPGAIAAQVDALQARFALVQPAIRDFVGQHGPDARLRQLSALMV